MAATYKVSGQVFNSKAEPIAGQQVLAADVDLLGAAIYKTAATVDELTANTGFEFLTIPTVVITTNIDGYYELSFSADMYKNNEIGLADVVVFAVDDGKITGRSKLATTKDYINDTEIQHLDIQLPDAGKRGASEYSRLVNVIQPFVRQNKLELFQLSSSAEQISFLADETSQDYTHTSLAVQSAKLCNDYQQYKFSPELFYGIGRQNINLSWAALLLKNAGELLAAIQLSVDQNIIAPQDNTQLNTLVTDISTAALEHSATAPETARLYETVGFAINDAALQKVVVNSFAQFRNSPKDFWNDLSKKEGISPEMIKSLQLTNQLSLLTNQHNPLIEQLQIAKGIKDPSDLLSLSTDDWNNIIKVTGVPDSIDGAKPEEKASIYISGMQNLLNAAYPTKKISLMINSGELYFADANVKEKVASVFNTIPGFDISNKRIADFDSAVKTVAGDLYDKVLESLQVIQRIYQLSPTPEVMNILIANGYRSAYHITSLSQNTFIEKEAAALGGNGIAYSVYDMARHQRARADYARLKVLDMVDETIPSKIISNEQQTAISKLVTDLNAAGDANWSGLFGSTRDCECSDCNSIFSPAAYLVDIMQYLDNCPVTAGKAPLAVLLERRPDIGNLLLTCENTNIEIPYIDLVNEVMEYYVAHSKDNTVPFTTGNTGSATSEELKGEPQNTLMSAYSTIYMDAVYPFELPYHQPLDVIRTYLKFLKTSRAELLEVFPFYKDSSNNPVGIPVNAIDAENLQLSLKEYEILTAKDFSEAAIGPVDTAVYYGSPVPAYIDGSIPVMDLLQRTGLEYAELVNILETKFINPGQDIYQVLQRLMVNVAVQPQLVYNELKDGSWKNSGSQTLTKLLQPNNVDPDYFGNWLNKAVNGSTNFQNFQRLVTLYEPTSACDLGKTVLSSLQKIYETTTPADNTAFNNFLSNLHRFIRLWRKTGWRIHEMDSLIVAMGKNAIDKDLIHNLGLVKKINDILHLPLIELACLWGNIDTYGGTSLYTQLFIKNTGWVSNNMGQEQSIFSPDPLNEILAQHSPLEAADLPALYAALNISAEEYSLIINDANINAEASLENLSSLYRYKLLADALGISVNDLCILKSSACFNINPFSTPDDTLAFIQSVQKLQSSGFSVAAFHYILSGAGIFIDNIALPQDSILAILPELRKKFLIIDPDNSDDAAEQQLKQEQIFSTAGTLTHLDLKIITAMPDAMVEALSGIMGVGLSGTYYKDNDFATVGLTRTDATIDFSWDVSASDPAIPADNFSIRWKGWICPPANGDYQFRINITETDEMAGLWIDGVKIIDINPAGAITKTLFGQSVAVSLIAGKMYPIVVEYVETSAKAGIHLLWQAETMVEAIIDDAFLYPDSPVQLFLQNIALCHRAAQFINGFKLNSEEVSYFIANKQDFSNIDFYGVTNIHWQRMYDYTSLRKMIPASSLLLLFQNAVAECTTNTAALPSDSFIMAIVNHTGWNKDYLSYLTGNAGYPANSPAVPAIRSFYGFSVGNFKNEIAFLRVKRALDLAKRTNMQVNESGLPAWVQIETNAGTIADFNSLHGIAEQITNAVKSKNNSNWPAIARQLNDAIRENNKQALISCLLMQNLSVNGKQVTDADGLYEYLLIDVQMTPAVVTSRLIQATMAVQLFVNRCLLGLENTAVAANAIAPSEWEWMKHYPIAAGLKKLFVYVENYLDPSLRDDKSEFFKELESGLNKSDITDINAENAFRDYLHKLNEVSNMEMCGMYNDTGTNTKHVFARTHSAPYNYYYRIQDSYGHWAAWEKVQLDIKSIDDNNNSGVHLMPVVWKKRLFLFWPEFMEKNIPADTGSDDFKSISNKSANDIAPQKYWEVRLAWSEYANGKWKTKKISDKVLTTPTGNPTLFQKLVSTKPGEYFFQISFIQNNILSIALYLLHERISFIPGQTYGVQFNYEIEFINYFIISDIHEKILVPQNTPWIDAINLKLENHGISLGASAQSPLYGSVYQSFEKKNTLDLSGFVFFRNSIDHKVLYSNDIVFTEFLDEIRYPFFYTDVNAQRTYFASPLNVSISQNLLNPVGASLALADTNSLVNQAVPASGVINAALVSQPLAHSGITRSLQKTAPVVSKMLITPATLAMNGARQNVQTVQVNPAPFNGAVFHNRFLDNPKLAFYSFYHPFAAIFIKKLNEGGLAALLSSNTAEFPTDMASGMIDTDPPIVANDKGNTFSVYNADPVCVKQYDPADSKRNYYLQNVDFSEYGAYSIYNWELFFHAPFLIATRLSKNGNYAEARKWFHYIFNPLSVETPAADNPNSPFWQVLPFKTKPLDDITGFINRLQPGYDTDPSEAKNTDDAQIDEWRADPFNAFLIARNRPIAFMKNVVMSYLDNLIAWGDDLFKTYTRENINEATQLYVMTAHILGPKPQYVPKRGTIPAGSYNTLSAQLDDFGDAVVSFENQFPNSSDITQTDNSIPQNLLGIGQTLYFCIPANDNLLQYWTKVGDRLFKIRNGQNIDGIVKPLALYEPPIDPLLLLKAKEQGLDIGSILSEIESPVPIYRFAYLLQKAKEFCGEVVAMGNALLSAHEKQDAEALSIMRQTQEVAMLQAVKDIKTRQVLEAQGNLDALTSSRQTSIQKLEYYSVQLLGNPETVVADVPALSDSLTEDSTLPSETIITPVTSSINVSLSNTDENGVKIIPKEKSEIDDLNTAYDFQLKASINSTLAGIMHLVPDLAAHATPFGIGAAINWGGKNLGWAANATTEVLQMISAGFTHSANQASRMASFIRREQEWVFQANMTMREIVQLDKQITVAQIRLQMAQHELENHNTQIENSQEIAQFLETKFSNQELYQWMIDKLKDVHKQGYQLAYDMARTAEKAYQFELGLPDSSFIQYGYYQDAFIGITAGEQLQLALNQMDSAYIENNVREFEIVKHISVAMTNPLALMVLRNTGSCEINLPEELFDLDFPGQYFRRIKSVSISIPCIAGPYTSINASLRLTKNEYRIDTNNPDGYKKSGDDDIRFRTVINPVSAIATSNAQNDSGIFELNFRDERYLPFEGAGVSSKWSLELMEESALRQFDYETISDVILHMKYTARESNALKTPAIENLRQVIKDVATTGMPLSVLFDVRHEFSNEWHQFINSTNNNIQLELPVSKDRLPFFAANNDVQVYQITLLTKKKDMSDPNAILFNTNLSMTFDNPINLFKKVISNISIPITESEYIFTLTMDKTDVAKLDELFLVLNYKLT